MKDLEPTLGCCDVCNQGNKTVLTFLGDSICVDCAVGFMSEFGEELDEDDVDFEETL